MSIHIGRFVDNIRAHESRGQRDMVMSIKDAKDLHAEITRLLLTLEELRSAPSKSADEVIRVDITGGSF